MSIDDRLTATGGPDVPAPTRKRRPIRGALSGLILGLGIVLLLIIYSAATFTSLVPFVVILVAFVAVGILVGLFAPTRRQRA